MEINGEIEMPKYMLDYIRLCRECSLDLRTVGNMRSIVIPTLQNEAKAIRAAVRERSGDFQELEQDAELLESAVRAGLLRCQPEPVQQSLFAA
ncbi:hypothetical protein V2J66_07415 [Pseudomonas alliivorans]|nr:hypothetical protein [Pseudomonas alliivorans]MEE5126103.1 hypothetical protein [Pseudomonas alliivorans]